MIYPRYRGTTRPITNTPSTPSETVETRVEVSVVLACLNEEDAVAATVTEARSGLMRASRAGEVIVVDNGSVDRSVDRALAAGARVIHESERGYGAAHQAGLRHARGNLIVMADADQTYDLERLEDLLRPLANGADLVVGTRLRGTIAPGAMPSLHRYLGTPLLTGMIRLLTGVRLTDSQSGYRAFHRDRVLALGARAQGMEYASEMLLKASRGGLVLAEVPTTYRRRVGPSKLNPLGDGWRHLHLLLLLSPHLSLVVPGVVCSVVGLVLCAVSLVAPAGILIGDGRWLPVFLGPMLLILGVQATGLGMLAVHRSALAPAFLQRRVRELSRPDVLPRLFGAFAMVALIGAGGDLGLLVLWLLGRSGPTFLGLAGLSQALIVIGVSGIATLLAVDLAPPAARLTATPGSDATESPTP